jgi:ribonuclease P protein component
VISRHRLRGRGRFAAIRAGGVRASAAGVRVQLASNDRGVARVGFALVGMRSAVRRNLLRRRLREALRPLLGTLTGRDVVVVAGGDALDMPFSDLSAALQVSLSRAAGRMDGATLPATADNGPVTRSPQAS